MPSLPWPRTPAPMPRRARQEALALAAAVAESAPGRCGRLGRRRRVAPARRTSSTRRAVAAAGGAPRRRSSACSRPSGPRTPLPTREALAEVAAAACELGEPTMRVVGNASVAAAAQLLRRPVGPGCPTAPVAVAAAVAEPGTADRRSAHGAERRRAAVAGSGGTGRARRGRSRSCSPSSTR